MLKESSASQLVYQLRLPRLLLTLLTGFAVSVSGFLMQKVSQNNLASPSMLGLVDGAVLGLVLAKFLGISSSLLLAVFSIGFSLLSLAVVYGIAALVPGGFLKTRLVLIGIVVGNVIGSLANLFAYQMSFFQEVSLYFVGSVTDATWLDVWLMLGTCLLVVPFLVYLLPQLEGFYLEEEVLKGLGMPVYRLKIIAFLLATCLSAVAVSLVGKLGFVGLIVPNLVGLLKIKGVVSQFMMTSLFGVILLLVADILAKLIRYPYETPISFVISLLGLPFFFWLLKRNGGRHV
ncbi:iron complex transport system permease protein [Streptococcus saliviloxodontae]|uniref:Iron complex transport system permease protein n=2 Tax=Streptococcus saliviloxodontae TaxID=1349416 RepID=A0ABS2PKR4_9STRE|nr:iron complex transport system permease protein [Streptococcus saliviloxodontae]